MIGNRFLGRQPRRWGLIRHRYTVKYSNDGSTWKTLIDRSGNNTDNTHVYVQLENKVNCRYLKINNIEVPDGHFALSGFRAFGKGYGAALDEVSRIEAVRNPVDRRSVTLTWDSVPNAVGYNISFGAVEGKLYNDYMVYNDNTVTINILNTNEDYYFTIESYNENGITPSNTTVYVE